MCLFIFYLKAILHGMLELLRFRKNKNSSECLNIYIKTNVGDQFAIELEPSRSIKSIKEIVAPKLGITPEEVKVIFAGKELSDSITISECDLGQKSTLHVVKIKERKLNSKPKVTPIEEEQPEQGSKPLCETLTNFYDTENNSNEENATEHRKAHFFVFCPTCKALKQGKLRVRCHFCKSGAFTVHWDPQNWDDVIIPKQITGTCENSPELCQEVLNNSEPTFAEFYFKCSEHESLGEGDGAVPLTLIRPNVKEVPCLACGDVSEPILVFPCGGESGGHVTCLECFRQYCDVRLKERQFHQHPQYGYTLACPAGCPDSYITEVHHFRLLSEIQYAQYQRFATEEFVLQSGGILCPQPGCGMGILFDPDCTKITCIGGCGYVFCRLCLQGYHLGDCVNPSDGQAEDSGGTSGSDDIYRVDPRRAAEARWDEASRIVIKVTTKPCPQCRTPTERDGGCMHMVCPQAKCRFHWCWVCQTAWTRECMGTHWFG